MVQGLLIIKLHGSRYQESLLGIWCRVLGNFNIFVCTADVPFNIERGASCTCKSEYKCFLSLIYLWIVKERVKG